MRHVSTHGLASAFLLTTLFGVILFAQPAPDLTTPREAMRHFIDSARAGDYAASAQAMNLADAGEEAGPRLARQLKFVLDRQLWIDWETISEQPEGTPEDGARTETIGRIVVSTGEVPIVLSRDPAGDWRLSRATVAAIPALYDEHGAGVFGEWLPEVLFRVRIFEVEAWQWLGLVVFALLAWLVGAVVGAALAGVLRRVAKRTEADWDDELLEAVLRPGRWLLAIVTFAAADTLLRLSVPAQAAVNGLLWTLAIATVTWLGLRLARFVADLLEHRLTQGVDDPPRVRGVRTQVRVLRRVANVVIGLVGGAVLLMQFDVVRTIGTSLLASAGIAGIVLGLAAQRSISTLLAGIQLSVTQPIRIGDTVIVENEWGQIEEITLTYVVVRVWDQRRLVVPITKFLESPFQNWTRASPEILGTVNVFADYTVPVQKVREELERIVKTKGAHLFDGRAVGLQVTDATERTVTLRALVSTADAGKNWDLCCLVREELVAYLQRLEGGRYLPKMRVETGAGEKVAEQAA